MTLLQIDNDQHYSPLLKIVWDGEERDLQSNSYWAIVNSNNCTSGDTDENCYDYYHLSTYTENSAIQFTLLVEDEQLTIEVDGKTVQSLDVSYWPTINNYFTAGVSNQFNNGTSIVQYQTLTFNTNLPIADLDANSAPSDNFDLLDWYLSVPTDTNGSGTADSIKENELSNGYEDDEFFYTNPDDGGMVFVCPINGYKTSTNTSYTRTELREMLRRGDTSIDTQSVNENNWVFSSTTQEAQENTGDIDGVLEATLAVNAVTTTGDSSQRGRVIVGQIHAKDDEPIRLYYRLLPGHDKGSIYFANEPQNGSEQWINVIGNRSDSASEPIDGIELNEKFYYKIKVQGNLLSLTIKRDYKDDIIKTVNMSGSGFDDTGQYMYFKAGVYNQNKSGDNDDYVQATFYYLSNQHSVYD